MGAAAGKRWILVAYAAVLVVAFLLLPSPWNLLAAGVVMLKGAIFLSLLRRAEQLGKGIGPRRDPPAGPQV